MKLIRNLFRIFPIRGRHRLAAALGLFFRNRWRGYQIGEITVPLNLSYEFHRYIITGIYEEGFCNWIEKNVHPAWICVDGGMNVGYITALLKRKGATVHAFEPSRLAVSLFRIFNPNPPKDLLISQNALYKRSGSLLTFHDGNRVLERGYGTLSKVNRPQKSHVIETKGFRLDDLSHIDFIKLDLEGGELYALEGMSNHLANHRVRYILIEHTPGDKLKFKLFKKGYWPHRIKRNGNLIRVDIQTVALKKEDIMWAYLHG